MLTRRRTCSGSRQLWELGWWRRPRSPCRSWWHVPAGAAKSQGRSRQDRRRRREGQDDGGRLDPFVTILPYKPAVAGETSTNGALGVAYFAFPSAKVAAAFVKKPSTIEVVQARNAVPVAYTYAAQAGFDSTKAPPMNPGSSPSAVEWPSSFSRARPWSSATYLGAAPANGSPYNLDAIGLSAATQEAATFLTAKPPATKMTTP